MRRGAVLRTASRVITAAWVFAAIASHSAGAVGIAGSRGYEMVSPPDKNGVNVMADPGRTRVASDGDAVSFASLGGFADVHGTGVATDYMSIRTGAPGTTGWTTHGITPPQEPLTFQEVTNTDPLYVGDFSADLDKGIFRAVSPLTEDPSVAAVTNLYRRADLRSPGKGVYSLVTPCPLCDVTHSPLPPLPPQAPGLLVPDYAGGSSDLSTVAFESDLSLTSDAPAQPPLCSFSAFFCVPSLYQSHDGQLALVGMVPPGAGITCGGSGAPACAAAPTSTAGQGVQGSHRPVNIVSADGARVFFTVRIPSTPASSGDLYVRVGNARTDKLNASERTDCADDPGCGPNGTPDPAPDSAQPARYWTASEDGSRVFFTTSEALTDDTPVGGNQSLYMYDTTKPASDTHNLSYINLDHERSNNDPLNSVEGVIGTSDDGSWIYFVAFGQLAPGAPVPSSGRSVYVWHEGELSYIGDIPTDDIRLNAPSDANYQLSSAQARVTPDGRRLMFVSHDGSGLAPKYDHDGHAELYVYSGDTHKLACISCMPNGTPATTDASDSLRTNASLAAQTWHMNRPLSDDGSRAFFMTAEALVPSDTNGKTDVYEYNLDSNAISLVSSGIDKADSYLLDASPSGQDVFFLTHEQLVGWDKDTSYDLYDARIGGGFPDPPVPPSACSGPACQGAPSAPPAAPSPGSASLDGAGNLTESVKPHQQAKRCKKGLVKRRIRGKRKCVRHKRATRKHRPAKHAGNRHQGRTR